MKKIIAKLVALVIMSILAFVMVGMPALKAASLANERRMYADANYYSYGTQEYDEGWIKIVQKNKEFAKEGHVQKFLATYGIIARVFCEVIVIAILSVTVLCIGLTVQYVNEKEDKKKNRKNRK